jgi:hypothetical protein
MVYSDVASCNISILQKLIGAIVDIFLCIYLCRGQVSIRFPLGAMLPLEIGLDYAFSGKPKSDWSGIDDISTRLMSDLCY